MQKIINNVLVRLSPKFNELGNFLTAFTCLLLFYNHPDFRVFYSTFFVSDLSNRGDDMFAIFGFIALIGLLLSIYHVFTKRQKNFIEVTLMGIFVMSVNAFSGIYAGIEMLPERWSFFALSPIWNILTGAFLLYQIGLARFTVTDDNTGIPELLVSTMILFLVYIFAKLNLQLSWAMTFSLVLSYSSFSIFILKWLKNVFRLQS